MSADKDRGIRRLKQKRAKDAKRQPKRQNQPADAQRDTTKSAARKPAE